MVSILEKEIRIYEEKIASLCKDPQSALALYLRFFIGGVVAREYARLYNINKDAIDKAFREIHRGFDLGIYGSDTLGERVIECVNKFSTELEAISRKRVEELNSLELEILGYTAYHISLYIPNEKKFLTENLGIIGSHIHKLAESLCSILHIDYRKAKETVINLMAKTGLAFYDAGSHKDGLFAIPPYAIKIINELARRVEQKFKQFVDIILNNSNDPKLISAILMAIYKHDKEDEQLFEAVYGENPYKYLQQIKFPYNHECSNHIVYGILADPITKIAKSHFDKIRSIITKALVQNDFGIIRIYEPGDYARFHGTIVASKGYEVAIRILPFYYQLFDLLSKEKIPFYYKAEREVIVIMGRIAKPDVFKKYKYVIVGLDNNYNVANIVDNVNEDWSKEIVEVFRSLNSSTQPKKDIMTKLNIYKAKAKEILEAIVATIFDNFGFKVRVNEQMKTYSGINIEVDVWAQKDALKVYVSCKNYGVSVVGQDVISNEIGRVMQLLEAPTIKIIVASEFTDQAKKVAERNGFIPIEIGFKVDKNNIMEAYDIIYKALSKYFGAS